MKMNITVQGYKFIFSNRPLYRLGRHLAFWVVFIFHYSLQNMLIGGAHEAAHYRSIPEVIQYDAFFFPAFLLSSYFFMYVIIPRFLLQRKIAAFVLSFSGLMLVNIFRPIIPGLLYIHVAE